MMVIASALAIPGLNSCEKSDVLPGDSRQTIHTINLVASQWNMESSGLFSTTFVNVISFNYSSVKIYLVTSAEDILINRPVSFRNGELWATNTQTDIVIRYRGSSANLTYLNIKVVVE